MLFAMEFLASLLVSQALSLLLLRFPLFPFIQAVFEGIRGRGYRGDIAIDDTEVKNGPCPPPGSCDFEKGLCAYQNELSGDDFDWERNTGHTVSIGTGPSVDHTTGTTTGMRL